MKTKPQRHGQWLPRQCRSIAGWCLLACLLVIGTFPGRAAENCPRTTIKFSEICYSPLTGQPQWVELFNVGTESVDARAMEIVSGTNSYSLPITLAEVPTNGFILVYFDGGGTDDTSFAGDNLAVLHCTITNFLGNPDGFASLYQVTGIHTPSTIVDFVAWGDNPGMYALDAVNRGIWTGTNVFLWTDSSNPPAGPVVDFVTPGQGLVRNSGMGWEIDTATVKSSIVASAKLYHIDLAVPQPFFPGDGLRLLSSPTRLRLTAVKGASVYEIQICTNQDFTNIFRSFTTSDPLPGAVVDPPLTNNTIYWWRARACDGNGNYSDWSEPQRFIVGFPRSSSSVPAVQPHVKPLIAGYTVSGQVVDSGIIPLGTLNPPAAPGLPGAEITINGQSSTSDANGNFLVSGLSPGTYAVNAAMAHYTFPAPPPNITISNANVSGVALSGTGAFNSLATFKPLAARKETVMLAITPGSQSRIMCDRVNTNLQGWDASHTDLLKIRSTDLEYDWCWAVGATMLNRFYKGSVTRDEVVYKVKHDLLHDADAAASWGECQAAIRFALNTDDAHIDYGSNPGNTQIQQWIDGGRPIYQWVSWAGGGAHITVIAGYEYLGGQFYTEHENIDNDGTVQWFCMDTDTRGSWCVHVAAPRTGLAGISADPGLASHSDGAANGVCDWDKLNRFNCNITTTDTDGDGIDDKTEIASWAFPRDGAGGYIAGKQFAIDTCLNAKAAQYTADTDGGGLKDGDEDKNHNGISGTWDMANPGETDVFDPSDDGGIDLVFCVDTTGSMTPYIAGVAASMISTINSLAATFPSYRVAIVGFKDYPDQDSAYLNYIYSDFTTNVSDLIDAVNAAEDDVGGGGDTPEAVYSGIIRCITDPALGGWRPSPVKRSIIVMGDAAAHDPEEDGTTLATVQAAAGSGGPTYNSSPELPAVTTLKAVTKAVDTNTLSGPISVFPVWEGYDPVAGASWTNIALATGGSVVRAPTGSDVGSAISTQVGMIKASTTASLNVIGPSGETNVRGLTNIVADASKSFDPAGCGILQYEWDWNGDGVYDQTTLGPIVTHGYPGGFAGPVSVRITTVGGDTAVATFTLPAYAPPAVAVLSETVSTTIDRQTGLFFQQIIITNSGSATINGLIISVTNLPPGMWCVSATGTNAGVPFVDFYGPLPPGQSLTLTLAYYSSNRTAPVGIGVSLQTTAPGIVTVSTGTPLAVKSSYLRADGKMAVEFDTLPGRTYVIEYTSDMITWNQAQPAVTGTGSRLIWVDTGPPVTESTIGGGRYYRILLLP